MKTSSSLWTSPPSHPPERGNLSLYLTDDNRHITKCHPCNATYFSGSGLICWPLTIESEDLLPYFADQEVEVVQDQWLSQGPTQIMWVLSSVLFFFLKLLSIFSHSCKFEGHCQGSESFGGRTSARLQLQKSWLWCFWLCHLEKTFSEPQFLNL